LSASSSPLRPAPRARSSYTRGARILSVGIAATGLLTLGYFAIASHVLGEQSAKRIDLLWSVMFVIISVIYRPVEQLLSRTIAQRRARGHVEQPVRIPAAIQASFALLFGVAVLALHEQIVDHVFDHYAGLYDVLVVGTLAYAASYFARGWLAGHEYFALYGGLVLMEALARVCFPLAVAVGVASGQNAVAAGIAAAPLVSLIVVPAAFLRAREERRQALSAAPGSLHEADATLAEAPITADEADAALAGPAAEGVQEALAHSSDELSLRGGTGFAGWVSGIMLSEQTLLNAAVLTVAATSRTALAGVVFNVLLIARAPLQLFQAIQTSLLPHLTGLDATASHAAFGRAVRVTVLAIAAFAGAVALGLLAIGPFMMSHLFGQHHSYDRFGLALIGLGMGLHLVSGTLNQAALARNRARAAACCWMLTAALFLGWMLSPVIGEQLLRTEIGYAGATAILASTLAVVYRRSHGHAGSSAPAGAHSASTDRAIAR
jgi:O-antigen/teichoic acid export membrane protein